MVANSLQPVAISLVELMGAHFLVRRQSRPGFPPKLGQRNDDVTSHRRKSSIMYEGGDIRR